jgi:hypothetical protein
MLFAFFAYKYPLTLRLSTPFLLHAFILSHFLIKVKI